MESFRVFTSWVMLFEGFEKCSKKFGAWRRGRIDPVGQGIFRRGALIYGERKFSLAATGRSSTGDQFR